MTIYSKEMKRTRRVVEDTIKENREECLLMGGDLNLRIGKRGARKRWMKEEEGKNREGKLLLLC
jgi:hypothetical protein